MMGKTQIQAITGKKLCRGGDQEFSQNNLEFEKLVIKNASEYIF